MTKNKVIGFALLFILMEAILPVPGPLTLGMLYVLFSRPQWFKAMVDCLYQA